MSTQLDAGKPAKPRRRLPLLAVLFILGLVSLSFVLGAAVMYYRWFTSDSLERAFIGAQAFADRRRALQMLEDASVTQGILDKPGKTYDGFTLYMYGVGTRAYLMNMQGEVVHEWGLPFSQIWPEPTHVAGPVDDSEVLFYVGHLYPNGDLLAILHGPGKPFYGYGLVKLDKDSKVLWKYAGNVHHALAVGDDGVIYALKHELVRQAPAGFKSVRPPFLLDSVVKLSPEGVELKSWPIFPAFHDSPYAPLLSQLERPEPPDTPGGPPPLRTPEGERVRDLLHVNSVQPLGPEPAPKFPLFRAGQLLISVRDLDVIAVLDPQSGALAWAARGAWEHQHDPQFLDNGRLLLFDNLGQPGRSRVLEYDPQTQALPWAYAGEKEAQFLTGYGGMAQRLPNGNTLVVNSASGLLMEVTPEKELVWYRSTGDAALHSARRYGPNYPRFLKGGQRARP